MILPEYAVRLDEIRARINAEEKRKGTYGESNLLIVLSFILTGDRLPMGKR